MINREPTPQQLRDELFWQFRINLQQKAELDRGQSAPAAMPSGAWQLSSLQLALPSTPHDRPACSDPSGWQASFRLAWFHLGAGQVDLAQAHHGDCCPT